MGQQSRTAFAQRGIEGRWLRSRAKSGAGRFARRIVIQPSENVTYSLDNLLAGITSGNAHSEFSFGKPVGKEAL